MKRQMCFQILRNEIEIFLHFYLFFYLRSSAIIVGSSYHHHHNEKMKVHLADNRDYKSRNKLSQTQLEIDPYKGLITLHC